MTDTYNLRLPPEARAIVTELSRLSGRNKQLATMRALTESLRRERAKHIKTGE